MPKKKTMSLTIADMTALSRLLDQALDLDTAQVDTWLAAMPTEHAHLLPRLREMLAEHQSHSHAGFMSGGPKLADGAGDPSLARVGDSVGPYRLIREIGRGGMGVVWLAERADGSVRRKVALKLPHANWAPSLGERFAREREILASLEHVNIARMYDAGVDQQGRPFMALEHVEGLPLGEFCARHLLPTEARLKLLLQVAAAVAYAHGRLVLHRDLKPGNILVTHDGQVRLLDFGIARMMEGGKAAATALTQHGSRALTLDYASPEQIRGEPVDTASDVYSLGVVAFELLAGERPYRLKRGSAAELEEAIVEQDLPLASAVAQTPAQRQALRGDLDAILNKALKKSPADRYGSVDALALDWLRHLEGQRVDARPDTLAYTATRLARRHRWPLLSGAVAALAFWLAIGLGATTLVIATLLVGLGAALWQARRASALARRAHEAVERTQAVKEFVSDVFRINTRRDPDAVTLRKAPAEMLLEHGASLIQTRFAGQPDIQAELYGVVGGIFADMSASRLAVDYFTRQSEALVQAGADDSRQARALLQRVLALKDDGRIGDCEGPARKALDLAHDDAALSNEATALLAGVLGASGQTDERDALLRRVKARLGGGTDPPSIAMAWLAWAQGHAAMQSNRFDLMVLSGLQAIDIAQRAEGPSSKTAARMKIVLGFNLIVANRQPEAMALIVPALAELEASGEAGVVRAAVDRADLWTQMEKERSIPSAEALAAVRHSRDAIDSLTVGVPQVIHARIDVDEASILVRRGSLAEAEALLMRSADVLRAAEDPQSFRVYELGSVEALLAMTSGRHDAADRILRDLAAQRMAIGQGDNANAATDFAGLAQNRTMQGRLDDAQAILDAAPSFQPMAGVPAQEQQSDESIAWGFARLRLQRGDAEGALATMHDLEDGDDWSEPYSLVALRAEALCGAGRATEGLPMMRDAIAARAGCADANDPTLARHRAVAGLCALAIGDRRHAEAMACESRAGFTAQPGVSPWFKEPLARLESALQTP